MNAIYPSPSRSWHRPAPRVVKGMRLVDAGVTVKDRILLHLLDHWGQMHRAEWPVELTQDGIATVVGISRSHVAVTLPDLIDEEMVEVTTQRVVGRPRRVKVYSLTFKGGSYAGRVARGLLRTDITAVDDTGEWEIPMDGLIQVHKVHMLSALRLVDEDNRVDLRKAADLTAPGEVEVPEGEEGVTEEEEGEEPEGAEDDAWVEAGAEAKVSAPLPVTGTAPASQAGAPEPSPPQAIAGTRDGQDGLTVRGGRPPPDDWYGYTKVDTRQAYFWSPLRFGSGRTPSVPYVATMLVMGFICLMAAVALFGLSPAYCAVTWIPLALVGSVFAWSGFKTTWALGDRRDVWTAAALSAYMTVGVTMVAFAAFGQEVLIDLLWASLVLGVPSLVLAAGTGRSTERRGSFMLFMGPVMVISALTMAVLDPGELGRTGAMPLLIVAVGMAWAAVGWTMVRSLEEVGPVPLLAAGGSIGLAIAALAGAGNLASDGALNPVLGTAMLLWVLGALYVAAIMLVPSLVTMRPDLRMIYIVLAVAGAAALLTAAVFFVWGGLISVGILEAVIAVGMMALVAPEMGEMGRPGLVLVVLGVLMAASSVMAVAVGL